MSNLDMTNIAETLSIQSKPLDTFVWPVYNRYSVVVDPSLVVSPSPTPTPPTPPTPSGTVTYYRLRGFYGVGGVYESWVSTNPDSSPPSGHALTNITQFVLNGT